MKRKIIFLSCLTIVGCSVVKVPTITGVNKENRIVRLGFEYGLLARPQPKWEQALISATEQCKSWGYKDAQEPSNAQTECKNRNRNGDCTQFFTYADYKCNLTNEMILYQQKQKRMQEIREQAEKQQQEQEKIELDKKREAELKEAIIRGNAEITKIKELCPNYRMARQICATAGSYSKCMEIKLEQSIQSIPSPTLLFSFSTKYYIERMDYLCNN